MERMEWEAWVKKWNTAERQLSVSNLFGTSPLKSLKDSSAISCKRARLPLQNYLTHLPKFPEMSFRIENKGLKTHTGRIHLLI